MIRTTRGGKVSGGVAKMPGNPSRKKRCPCRLDERIDELSAEIKTLADEDSSCQRLMTAKSTRQSLKYLNPDVVLPA
jgi:hypothetical protein